MTEVRNSGLPVFFSSRTKRTMCSLVEVTLTRMLVILLMHVTLFGSISSRVMVCYYYMHDSCTYGQNMSYYVPSYHGEANDSFLSKMKGPKWSGEFNVCQGLT